MFLRMPVNTGVTWPRTLKATFILKYLQKFNFRKESNHKHNKVISSKIKNDEWIYNTITNKTTQSKLCKIIKILISYLYRRPQTTPSNNNNNKKTHKKLFLEWQVTHESSKTTCKHNTVSNNALGNSQFRFYQLCYCVKKKSAPGHFCYINDINSRHFLLIALYLI